MPDKRLIGKWGENLAEAYLKERGYVVVDKNWRTTQGEIDLVVKHGPNQFVFVEVKTRTGKGFGYPEEAVTRKKRKTLIQLAYEYILTHQIVDDWRIDVIAIIKKTGEDREIEWFQDAIREDQ